MVIRANQPIEQWTPHIIFSRSLIIWLTLLVCLGGVAGADRIKPPFPEIKVRGHVRNENAIQALGDKIGEVAAWYGKSADELEKLLRHDKDLWVSPNGRLLYACELELPSAADAPLIRDGGTVQLASFPLEQTFLLHSNRGSNKVIYLDFNGQTVSGTAWNSSYNSGNPIVAAPFDTDGNPASFSAGELQAIQNVWKRVAEDYSPFDVDITTEEPAAAALTRTSSSDTQYGIRVVITPTNFYPNAGGVSYIGVFDDTSETYKTSWAFSNMLANGEKYIGEACSHESGHALGLHHEGTTSGTTYYQGQGDWAPIMGNSYYKNVTQWARGEYSGANNTEDQLQVMQTNGLSYYPDDHGNNAAAATVLPASISLSGSGFIETNADLDVFKFTAGAGPLAFTVSRAPLGPNLNFMVELRDSSWSVLAQSAPSISATVAAGAYYLVITGTGSGDPLTTGYSKYGSLGQYTFTGTVANPGSVSPPVAAASATPTIGMAPLTVNFTSAGSYANGTITGYAWSFGDGATGTGATASHIYTAAGSYAARLTVTDSAGLSGTATVNITVNPAAPAPPSVSITSPANGSTVSGTVTVQASASGAAAITSVAFKVDGVTVSSDTSSPYTYSWGTKSVANGSHTLTATATDANNLSTSTSVSVTVNNVTAVDVNPPSVVITSPAPTTYVPINVSVQVRASDDVGVTRVELYVDGAAKPTSTSTTAPFTTKWNSNKAAKGPHTLSVKAYDASGKSTSSSVTVNK